MKNVEPIRNLKKLEDFKSYLKAKHKKYFVMATLGLNLGMRIGDILRIKVYDVYQKEQLEIIEEKTNKFRRNKLSKYLQDIINNFVEEENLSPDEYLIFSNKKGKNGEPKAISRVQAYTVIREAAEAVGIKNIGTHSLRKTFGYHHYQKNHDVAILQQIFNHSAPSVTLRYIGINQDIINESLTDFQL